MRGSKQKRAGSGGHLGAFQFVSRSRSFTPVPTLWISHSRTRRRLDRTPRIPLKPEKSTAEFAENLKLGRPVLPSGRGVRRQHGATHVSTSMPRPLHIPERNFSDVFRPAVSRGHAAFPDGRAPQATPPGPMVGLRKLRLQALWSGSASYASKIAVTPCPPAAQTEIRPRTGLPVSFFFSASCLANCATIRPPVAANG